ncbi:MAG: Holliday junction branch migration protein RuvA [Chloroflexi bacterium]|nr:Holliday junction branch migration protein RuvA [Chloroflexota bacterium]
MIVNVRGSLEAVGPDWVHIQVGGVTLQVFVPAAGISQLGPIGGQIKLYTHLRMRDEQPVLYGFPDAAALDLFLKLTGVSGVGPRLSLALLSSLNPGQLQNAIANGDLDAITAAPGVGRRTAGRIILELKGKLEAGPVESPTAPGSQDAEVVEALMALGYSSTEARRAVNGLEADVELTLEERIRLALQQFGAGG